LLLAWRHTIHSSDAVSSGIQPSFSSTRTTIAPLKEPRGGGFVRRPGRIPRRLIGLWPFPPCTVGR
jgi:hypothetical protein